MRDQQQDAADTGDHAHPPTYCHCGSVAYTGERATGARIRQRKRKRGGRSVLILQAVTSPAGLSHDEEKHEHRRRPGKEAKRGAVHRF